MHTDCQDLEALLGTKYYQDLAHKVWVSLTEGISKSCPLAAVVITSPASGQHLNHGSKALTNPLS